MYTGLSSLPGQSNKKTSFCISSQIQTAQP